MLLRTFVADSSTAALRQIREELGEDAVVLKSRQVSDQSGRTQIEITACTDAPVPRTTSKTVGAPSRLRAFQPTRVNSRSNAPVQTGNRIAQRVSVNDDSNKQLEPWRTRLLEAELPGTAVASLLSDIAVQRATESVDIQRALESSMARQVSSLIAPERTVESGERILFVGPAGSGKSSALGKLAAQLISKQHVTVNLRSLDDVKVSAEEEIAGYADLLGARLVLSNEELASTPDTSVTLIDTPGFPNEPRAHARLMAAIAAIRPTCAYLILSALHRPADLQELIGRLTIPAPLNVIYTMTDCTARWGGLLGMLDNNRHQLAWMTNAPSGIGSLVQPDAAAIAHTIITGERHHA